MYGQMIAGGVAGFAQAYMNSRIAEQEARFNEKVALYNGTLARNAAIEQRNQEIYAGQLRERDAELAGMNAGVALQTAERVEGDVRRDSERYQSSLRAGAASAGIRSTSGSARLVQLEAARMGEYHATVAGFQHRMAEFAHKEDKRMFEHEAAVHEQRADYLTQHGIEASGALYDAQATWYGDWARWQSDTRWTAAIASGASQAFGGPAHPKVDPQTPSARDEQAYQSYRTGERDRTPYRVDEPEMNNAGRDYDFYDREFSGNYGSQINTNADAQASWYGHAPSGGAY